MTPIPIVYLGDVGMGDFPITLTDTVPAFDGEDLLTLVAQFYVHNGTSGYLPFEAKAFRDDCYATIQPGGGQDTCLTSFFSETGCHFGEDVEAHPWNAGITTPEFEYNAWRNCGGSIIQSYKVGDDNDEFATIITYLAWTPVFAAIPAGTKIGLCTQTGGTTADEGWAPPYAWGVIRLFSGISPGHGVSDDRCTGNFCSTPPESVPDHPSFRIVSDINPQDFSPDAEVIFGAVVYGDKIHPRSNSLYCHQADQDSGHDPFDPCACCDECVFDPETLSDTCVDIIEPVVEDVTMTAAQTLCESTTVIEDFIGDVLAAPVWDMDAGVQVMDTRTLTTSNGFDHTCVDMSSDPSDDCPCISMDWILRVAFSFRIRAPGQGIDTTVTVFNGGGQPASENNAAGELWEFWWGSGFCCTDQFWLSPDPFEATFCNLFGMDTDEVIECCDNPIGIYGRCGGPSTTTGDGVWDETLIGVEVKDFRVARVGVLNE